LQLDGVLFMEGRGEPAEITRLKREIRTLAEDQETTSRWLADAMQATWEAGKALFEFPALADSSANVTGSSRTTGKQQR
jgi:hypothetical protein